MPVPPKTEIFEKVRQSLVDTLSVDADEVTEGARLTADLGAESIDILDLTFRLEKAFGVKMSQEELISREFLSNPAYVSDKKLNPQGLAELRKIVPGGAFDEFERDPVVDKVLDVFTVGSIMSLIERKLSQAA